VLGLSVALAAAVGCGSGTSNSPTELGQTDDQAVAQAFQQLHADVLKARAAKEVGKVAHRNFKDVPGGAPPVPGSLEARQRLRADVHQIIDAVEDEAPDRTVPSQGGSTVSAFLSQVANTVQPVDTAAAADLDRTREALTPGAVGGPSGTTSTTTNAAPKPTTTAQQPDALADAERTLKSAGYNVSNEGKAPIGPASISGLRVTGQGISSDAPVIIFAYGSAADAQAAAEAYQAHTPQGGATRVAGDAKVYFSADAGSLSAVLAASG
jgi:hypothetical protein